MVLFSLVGQGLSIKPLIEWLGVTKKEKGYKAYEELLARAHRFENAITEINKAKKNLLITEMVTRELVDEYEQTLESLHKDMELLFQEHPELKEKQQTTLQKYALYAQHEAINRLLKEDIISNEVAEQEHELITNKLVELEEEQ
ncbi:hypothetical protein ACFQ3N_12890 [Virgibacillus byunsanensis]|uniref:Uncharacterized protein n=1 Tax=Virgibacillus byunsanensis TaxID=570945 RepID=A0ABW3LML9_9BACI